MVEPFDFHSYLGIFTLPSVSFYRRSYICLHYIFNSLEPEHWQVVTSLLPITKTIQSPVTLQPGPTTDKSKRGWGNSHAQLGRLGYRDSYWAGWASEPSCWRDPPCTRWIYANVYILSLEDLHPDQTERGAGWGHWFRQVLWVPTCDLCDQPHTCVFVIYTCALCCVLTGNTFSAPLLVGPDDMKLHQVCPSQAFRSSPIFSPNITQAGLRKFSRTSIAPDVWLDIAAYVFAVTAAEPWDKGCGTSIEVFKGTLNRQKQSL